MTQSQCTRQQSGLRGMTIRTSPSSALQLLAHPIQVVVIHLATDSSHGAAATLSRSLSSQASAHRSSSARASNHHRVGISSSNKTRTYRNFLDNATSVVIQGTKCQRLGPGHSKLAEVTSLKESSRNLLTGWDQAHIIRETNERATREE